jgi:hypothetical protein
MMFRNVLANHLCQDKPRHGADLRFRTNKNRSNQFILECLNRASERYFVARPDNRSSYRGLGGGARDQAKVVAIRVIHNKLWY